MSMYGKWPKNSNGTEKKAVPIVDCSKDELLTVQADTDQADINKIIARFEKAGMMDQLNKGEPFYGDVSDFDGLQDAYIKVQEAEKLFMKMDARIRSRFDNDAVKLVRFLEDERNYDEAVVLGIVTPKPAPAPVPTPTPAASPKPV